MITGLRDKDRRNQGSIMKSFRIWLTAGALLAAPLALQAQINLPSLGDSLASTISSQQEYEMGREFMRAIRRDTRMLNDPLIEEYIASVSYKLAASSELNDLRLDFILIDNEMLNAFAAPGGIIGVNAGLFLYAENEGQFASVIAHELAHISQRHYARSVEQARNNALPNMAALLASVLVAATVGGDAGQAAIMGTQAAAVNNQLRFSRSNEEEADRIGIRTLYNAGFDPTDMAGMFQNMMRAKSFSQRPPEFLSTHPLDENRIADSRNRANGYPRVDAVYNIEYLLMRQRVAVRYAASPDALISQLERQLPQLNGQEADAARYGLALAQLARGDFVKASESLDALLAKEPRRITYVALQADIAREAGDYARAREILEDNLRINPGNHPLTMAYASVLEESGDFAAAAQLLERHSARRGGDVNLWYQLAEVQGRAGNISKVHQARAEYFLTIGEFTRARDQINFALALEQDPVVSARLRQKLDDIRTIQNRFYR